MTTSTPSPLLIGAMLLATALPGAAEDECFDRDLEEGDIRLICTQPPAWVYNFRKSGRIVFFHRKLTDEEIKANDAIWLGMSVCQGEVRPLRDKVGGKAKGVYQGRLCGKWFPNFGVRDARCGPPTRGEDCPRKGE